MEKHYLDIEYETHFVHVLGFYLWSHVNNINAFAYLNYKKHLESGLDTPTSGQSKFNCKSDSVKVQI